jgi:serine/threonine protein kinase
MDHWGGPCFVSSQKEIEVTDYLCYPSIAALHDFQEQTHFYCMFMGYCGGEVYRRSLSSGKLSAPTAALVSKQIAPAIHQYHIQGVAHRNLKLGNILIASFPHLKVTRYRTSSIFDGEVPTFAFAESRHLKG